MLISDLVAGFHVPDEFLCLQIHEGLLSEGQGNGHHSCVGKSLAGSTTKLLFSSVVRDILCMMDQNRYY